MREPLHHLPNLTNTWTQTQGRSSTENEDRDLPAHNEILSGVMYDANARKRTIRRV